jgi:hypothetical protein
MYVFQYPDLVLLYIIFIHWVSIPSFSNWLYLFSILIIKTLITVFIYFAYRPTSYSDFALTT